MGTKPKFWCLDSGGAQYLFKQSRPHSGEHWSEKVAAEIASALQVPHAQIELAVNNGLNGTISPDFLAADDTADLIHGNELLNEYDPEYPRDGANFRVVQHTLDRIFAAISSVGAGLPRRFTGPEAVTTACELFVGYLLLDALIGNTDRHHSNWAVVVSPCGDGTLLAELSPTYDHASSLGRELTDERRSAKLTAERMRHDPRKPARRDQTVVGYLEKDEGRSRIYASEHDSKPLHPMQSLQQASERFPLAADAWIDQLARLDGAIFKNIVAQVPDEAMSRQSRELCLCLLELNQKAIVNRTFRYD